MTQIQRIDGLQDEHIKSTIISCKRNSVTMDTDHEVGEGYSMNCDEVGCSNTDGFASEPDPKFTLESFKKCADDFKNQYFCSSKDVFSNMDSDGCSKQWKPSVENIEGEYRRIIENPTEEMEVCWKKADTNTHKQICIHVYDKHIESLLLYFFPFQCEALIIILLVLGALW